MSHPTDKKERLLLGQKEGLRRAKAFFGEVIGSKEKKWLLEASRRFRDGTTKCSRPLCCGNPRRLGQLTMQERRENDRFIQWD